MSYEINWSDQNLTNDQLVEKLKNYLTDKERLRVKGIDLSGNQLIDLKNVKFPENLEYLNLSCNKLTSLDGVIFPDGLKELRLMFCNLTSIDCVVFPKGLKRLNLYGNQLTDLKDVKFSRMLRELNLTKNPLSPLDNIRFPLFATVELDWKSMQEKESYTKKIIGRRIKCFLIAALTYGAIGMGVTKILRKLFTILSSGIIGI